jgi:ABC-type nickel/cobalt efflux system permease component RcnA
MTESLVGSSYVAILMIGLIHGLEPGHGWPVAALLSTATKRRYAYGLAASLILSAAHFVSSLAVVAIYFVMTTFFGTAIDFGAPWFKIATAAALLILAYRFYREKEHPYSPHEENADSHFDEAGQEDVHGNDSEGAHDGRGQSRFGGKPVTSLKGLAGFAFVLGFAHEEEFMLFALFIGGVSPLLGMSLYATAVTISLVLITLLAIKAFSAVEAKMSRYSKYIPKVTAVVLAVLAILFLLPVFGGPNVY